MKSIKKTLIKHSLFKIMLTIVVVSCFAIYNTYDEVQEIHDVQLSQTAKFLAYFANEHKNGSIKIDQTFIHKENFTSHNFEDKKAYRVWINDNLIAQSDSASKFENIKTILGYQNVELADGSTWRVFRSYGLDKTSIIEISEDMSVRTEILFEIILSFIIPILLLVPLLILTVYWGAIYALKPLMELSEIMNKKDANNFDEVYLENNSVEVNPLINSINTMLNKIRKSFEKERSFTDHAAHELRTPLAVLKTQTQAISQKYNTIPELSNNLNDLELGINRMSKMVEQLLSFSRLQNKEIKFMDTNISLLVNNILQNLAVLAINKNIELNINIEDNLIVKGDSFSLSLAISNLIDNAIKYTKENNSIYVSLFKESGKIVFTVKDEGIGLSSEDKKHLFDKFYRNKKQDSIGSGLGLSIVKLIVDLHHADIILEDNSPKGSIFKIVF